MVIRSLLLLLSFSPWALAQAPQIIGDYSGSLGPLHVKLHLKAGTNGALAGSLDSPDQGATGLECANIKLDGNKLSFEVPTVNGSWSGTITDNGATLAGSWNQGSETPLNFHRDGSFVAAEKPSRVDGVWLGTLDAGGTKVRLQFQVKSDRAGKEYCTADSPDQGIAGLECDGVRLEVDNFSFDIPVIHGHYSGKLSESGNELDGTWTQGKGFPLKLARQAAAVEPAKPAPPKYDEARAAVPLAQLKATLDADLANSLKSGALAPETGGGVVIGVIEHGKRQIFVYGDTKPDSIFEIGSMTKTFTGLILAQMVEQGKVRLDEPVRELLPKGTVDKPAGAEITLLDLASQHSGLPRMPDNFHPGKSTRPVCGLRLQTAL